MVQTAPLNETIVRPDEVLHRANGKQKTAMENMKSHSMKAVHVVGGSGPAEALSIIELPIPVPGPGQVLIRTKAAGVNRPDVFQRQGLYPPPAGAPETLGLEVAGIIEAIGPDVKRWSVGDRVVALLGGGGYAEYALADAAQTLPMPTGLDYVQACGLPETAFTVFANVVEHGSLRAGETILIHGATSGIGVMAIQLAKALGSRVIATGRGVEKAKKALELGADISVNTSVEDFVEVVERSGGADVILDMVGGPYFEMNLAALNGKGRLVQIAWQAGANVELSLPLLMRKQLVITGSTLRGRDKEEKARLASLVERVVWPLVENGKLQTIVEDVFPLSEASSAHKRLEEGSHVGKIVLKV